MNRVNEFILNYNNCEICNAKLNLYFEFENFQQYKGIYSNQNDILFIPQIKNTKSDGLFFEYSLKNNEFIFDNSFSNKELCKYNFYITYLCPNTHEHSYSSIYCFCVISNQLNLSNYKSNFSKFNYYTPEQKSKSIWSIKFFTIKDNNELYIVHNNYNSTTNIHKLNKNSNIKNKIAKLKYNDLYSDLNNKELILKKSRNFAML